MSNGSTLREKLLDGLKSRAGGTIAVGVVLIIAGILGIASPLLSGLSVMVMMGCLLLLGGLSVAGLAFGVGAFGRGVALLLLGILMGVAGWSIMTRPLSALASMTLFLAAYFVISGIVELVSAIGEAPAPGRGWMMVSGLVSIVLGVMLWTHFPASAGVAVGVLFGARLLFNGLWLLNVGMAAKRVAGALK